MNTQAYFIIILDIYSLPTSHNNKKSKYGVSSPRQFVSSRYVLISQSYTEADIKADRSCGFWLSVELLLVWEKRSGNRYTVDPSDSRSASASKLYLEKLRIHLK